MEKSDQVLLLNNQELESVLDMRSSIEALFQGLKAYARGDAARRPRVDIFAPTSRAEEFASFSSMEGIIRGGYYALRLKPDIISWPVVDGIKRRATYCVEPGLYGGLILLFSAENGALLAIMNDGFIQHMRDRRARRAVSLAVRRRRRRHDRLGRYGALSCAGIFRRAGAPQDQSLQPEPGASDFLLSRDERKERRGGCAREKRA